MPPKLVIFTDLDGTLLDHDTYSFEPALKALEVIRSKDVPLVFCTSKTRAEIERWRRLTENTHPFVSENGGAIYIPRGYFKHEFDYDKEINGYRVIELGTPYETLSAALKSISSGAGIRIKGVSDMSVDEVRGLTGLDEESAASAKRREYGEPFLIYGDASDIDRVKSGIERAGFRHTHGGRFHHILGGNDKGRAAAILAGLYRAELGQIITAGIGDSPNDLPMLEAVDIPILVRRPDSAYDERVMVRNLIVADAPGPAGWGSEVLKLLLKY